MTSEEDRLALALGRALVQIWGELPQEMQQTIFERAVTADPGAAADNAIREKLAVYCMTGTRGPREAPRQWPSRSYRIL